MEKTIVVIDDDFDDYVFLKDAVKEYDPSFTCIYFDDSDCALDTLLSIQNYRPDYIFIDINMPKATGDECLRALRSSPIFKDIAIIMLSTFMSPEYASVLKEDGATYATQKPNSMKGYMQMLEKIFGNKAI